MKNVGHVYAVLIHGWGGSPRIWDFIRWPEDWTIILYELPGHGNRKNEGPWNIPGAAEDLAEFIRHVIPPGERALLIAHSMGGNLSLYVHAHYPELVAGEVVIDPALGASETPQARQSNINLLRRLVRDPYGTMDKFVRGAFSQFTPDAVRSVILDDIHRTNATAFADYYRSEYMDSESFGNRLPAIALARKRTRPTFGIYLTPARADFERDCGTKDIAIWSGGHGHFMFLEDPMRFIDEVVSWAISRELYENTSEELRLNSITSFM